MASDMTCHGIYVRTQQHVVPRCPQFAYNRHSITVIVEGIKVLLSGGKCERKEDSQFCLSLTFISWFQSASRNNKAGQN